MFHKMALALAFALTLLSLALTATAVAWGDVVLPNDIPVLCVHSEEVAVLPIQDKKILQTSRRGNLRKEDRGTVRDIGEGGVPLRSQLVDGGGGEGILGQVDAAAGGVAVEHGPGDFGGGGDGKECEGEGEGEGHVGGHRSIRTFKKVSLIHFIQI